MSVLNPFTPGAGHMPPYLAGRNLETQTFDRLLKQDRILSNVILTGLRGVGKTVLMETWRPLAISQKWLWVGTDLSESTSINEDTMIIRMLTDLSVVTSGFAVDGGAPRQIGFNQTTPESGSLNYEKLLSIYKSTPGLASDKMKAVLELAAVTVKGHGFKGIIFAYDEAQTISDHAEKEAFPLSLMLDIFQSIQKKGVSFMLVFAGLPTLFPKLVETRTYSERMFEVITLGRLQSADCQEAIIKPVKAANCPLQFNQAYVDLIIKTSGGYPYFIQFMCKEVFDLVLQKYNIGETLPSVPISAIVRKLDKDFFAGRWGKATDRQRQLLSIIAGLDNCNDEFTVQQIVAEAKSIANPFSSSHVNQMLGTLTEAGLIYKNRYGKYSFAVPLLGEFILRQEREANL